MRKNGIVLCFLAWIGIFHALNAQILQKKYLQVELLSEHASIVPGERFWLAIHFQIEPYWHIYWKNPGDTGVPPTFEWKLPPAIQVAQTLWPCPERIEDFSLVNYGYSGSAVFLTEMKTASTLTEEEITVDVQIEWLVCKEICIHDGTTLSLKLPIKKESPEFNASQKDLFQKARNALPAELPHWTLQAQIHEKTIEIQITPPSGFSEAIQNIYFFPQEAGIIEDSALQLWSKQETSSQLTLTRSMMVGKKTSLLQGILILIQNEKKKAFQVQIPVTS